jgi:SNF2 family DNA or RNA helicase
LIKNPKSIRTDNATAIGGLCDRRMILTGTSTTQGIEDLFAQFRYLDWRIIGNKSFFSFKARYCITGGYQNRSIVGYQNQDDLLTKISPYTFIVSKDEMLDLPEQVYEQVFVEPTVEQSRALKDLGDPFMMATTIDEIELVVETVLERMLRYQQIVGGHFPIGEGAKVMAMPGKNPKMNAVMEIIDGLRPNDKVIIWARFVAETNMIYNYLEDKHPGSACLYVGSTPSENRRHILEAFQTDPKVRFFVSNQTVGGAGITLTAASTTIYYSNTFSYKDREQSEGRNHRKGQDNKVTYFDIVMKHKIDRMIIDALRRKKSIDQYVRQELTSMQHASIP